MNHSVLWLSDWQCKAMIRPGSNKNWLRLGGLPTVEPIYWRKWVFPTKKKCSGAQGRRWSIARSPLDNSCLRRTPDFSLKATVKIYHIDILLSDISSRISCKNLSLPAMNLISEQILFESENLNLKMSFLRSNFSKNSRQNGHHATSRFTILSHSSWRKIEEICDIIIFSSPRAPLSPNI